MICLQSNFQTATKASEEHVILCPRVNPVKRFGVNLLTLL